VMKTIEQAAFECAQKLDCPNLNIGHAAIIAAAMREVCEQAIDNWDDIELIIAERNRLRAGLDVAEGALKDVAMYDEHSQFGGGMCPYGCDTPNIARQALARIAEARK